MSNGIDSKCVSPVERSDLMCSCESSAGGKEASVFDVREREKFFLKFFFRLYRNLSSVKLLRY